MNNQTIVCCVVALLLGMLLANMLKNVCGCKLVEGLNNNNNANSGLNNNNNDDPGLGLAAAISGSAECAQKYETCKEFLPVENIMQAMEFGGCCKAEELADEM
tara:strand:+ start:1068 stop:1376 length:309 start_codon:yes stop_codon:yes gene_type:complete